MSWESARVQWLAPLVMLVLFVGSMITATATAGAASTTPSDTSPEIQTPSAIAGVPVTGTFTDEFGGTGVFEGTFTPERFRLVGGEVAAVGTLEGTLIDSAGDVVGTVDDTFTIGVSSITGTCEILHLELGPLDLDLLGLVVHLDQIVLDITAEQGPGNLLGNLLCAIAGLLDGPASDNVIARLLNNILRLLG